MLAPETGAAQETRTVLFSELWKAVSSRLVGVSAAACVLDYKQVWVLDYKWRASTIPSSHKRCWFTCNLKGRGDRNRYSVTICISVESSECVLARISSSYGQCVSVCCFNKVSHCLREYKAAVIQHCSAVSRPRNYRWRSTSSGAGESEHWRLNIGFCQQLELKSIL